MEICSKSTCVGCGVCSIKCPKNCIHMVNDDLGHLYPNIDSNNCIECGICIKSCPQNINNKNNSAFEVYACWSKNKSIRKDSTSGGIATTLALYAIENNYVVYGSALENHEIHHIRITEKESIKLIQGSKYVESPINSVLPNIKKDLDNGKKVVFFGTPCQCAAVKVLVGDYDTSIVLVEVICSGVPAQKLLWEHLQINDLTRIKFRDEIGSRLSVWNEDSLLYQKPIWRDYFLMGFRNHLFLRSSCYECNYSSMNRVADLTLGDYWGIGKDFRIRNDISDGVSVVFINSIKGEKIFEEIKELIFCEKRTLEEAIEGNPRYVTCSEKHPNNNYFVSQYLKKGFKNATKKSLKKERINYFLYYIKRCTKDILFRVLK